MSYKQAEEQLHNALVTTYLSNLTFLKEYAFSLFQRVDGLSQYIASEEYKERFRLEFNKDDGEFDVYDIEHDIFLYNKAPKKKNNLIVSKINFNTIGSFSILEEKTLNGEILFETPTETIFDQAARKLSENINEFHSVLGDKKFNYKNAEVKDINKIVFIGTLLGRHIPRILNKTKAKNLFICEQNLEIFRLSLFVVDYSALATSANTLVLSIMDEVDDFNSKFKAFLQTESFNNGCVKYVSTDYNVANFFDPIMDMLSVEKSTVFNHHLLLDNVTKLSFNRFYKYKILNNYFPNNDCNIFDNKPVLYLGAGPSLSKNIEWIHKNKDKFIIVSIAATINLLIAHDIIPDIVVTLDPQFEILDKIHFSNEIIPKIKNTLIFASMNTDQRILDKLNQENLYLYEVIQSILPTSSVNSALTVGETGASLLLNFGVKELYLIGLDLSLNQETGETHSSDYITSKFNIENIELAIEKNSFSLKDDLVYIKGNQKEKVITSRIFNASVNIFSRTIIDTKKESQNIYNLSNNGAYFANTIPMIVEDIKSKNLDFIEKEDKNRILNSFNTLSIKNINKKTLDFLEEEINYLEHMKDDILKTKDKSVKNFNDFNTRYNQIYKFLVNPKIKTAFIRNIAFAYFNAIMPYLYYYFNNKKIKKENKKLNEVSIILDNQIIVILNKYISYLEEFLGNKKG